MRINQFEKSRLIKSFWLGIVPIIVLISIQFLVLAASGDDSEIEFEKKTENSNDFVDIVRNYDLSSHYLFSFSGKASHYAHRFHNRKTASGERFDMFENTAAHRKLPFGTIIKVTNTATGKVALVRINDRGPHHRKRVIDLSYSAAKAIEGLGLPNVKIEGFLRGKHRIEENLGAEYYFAYSYDYSPICLPKSKIDIMDSTLVFGDAIDKLDAYLAEKKEDNIFLLVDTDLKQNDENAKFFIGRVGRSNAKSDLTKK